MLGCTARLAPPKDLITLLDALAQPGCERWDLRVFGDGPDREAIERHRDALGLAERVTLLGNRDDVAAQLADCDAFALISDWEGLPYSILEAMAAGLPVLATAVGGIADLVVPGQHGRARARARRRAAAARVLAAWASAPAAAPAARPAPRTRARCASFSRERMVGRYEALFASLLLGLGARAACDDALRRELGALDEARERAEAALGREADERELRHVRAERAVEHRPAVLDRDARAQVGREHRQPVAAEHEAAGDDARVDLAARAVAQREREAVGPRIDRAHLDALADRDHAVDVPAEPGRGAGTQQERVDACPQRVRQAGRTRRDAAQSG